MSVLRCVYCRYWGASCCKYWHVEDLRIVDGYLDQHLVDCHSFENAFITPGEFRERVGREFGGAVWVLMESLLGGGVGGDFMVGVRLYGVYKHEDGAPLPLCVLGDEVPCVEDFGVGVKVDVKGGGDDIVGRVLSTVSCKTCEFKDRRLLEEPCLSHLGEVPCGGFRRVEKVDFYV